MPFLPFLKTGFRAKIRERLRKELTRRPWRYVFCKMARCSLMNILYSRKKLLQKKKKRIIIYWYSP